MMKILKRGKLLVFCALLCLLFATVASAAGSGDVASAVESTWTTASEQIKTVVDTAKRTAPAVKCQCQTDDAVAHKRPSNRGIQGIRHTAA